MHKFLAVCWVTRPSPAVSVAGAHTFEEFDFFLTSRSWQTHTIDSELVSHEFIYLEQSLRKSFGEEVTTVDDHGHLAAKARGRNNHFCKLSRSLGNKLLGDNAPKRPARFPRAVHVPSKLPHESIGAQPFRRVTTMSSSNGAWQKGTLQSQPARHRASAPTLCPNDDASLRVLRYVATFCPNELLSDQARSHSVLSRKVEPLGIRLISWLRASRTASSGRG